MANDTDAQFLRRISSLENDLLALNRTSIDSFNHRWTNLVSDLQVAMNAEQLSVSTIQLALVLSNRVSHVVQTFYDLEVLAEKLMSSLLDETSPNVDSAETTSGAFEVSDPAISSYIKASYDWLIHNIHNPYPSTHVRDTIARSSGANRKDVDNWFIDARKRIGWNEARRTYFSNKRVDIVDAATRFYANDEKLSLSQGAEHALISIMKNAKDLYSDKFGETILARKLAAVVKDLTPETKAEAKAEQVRQAQLRKDRDSYPSPDRSPEPAQSLDSCDDEVDNIITQSVSMTSRKRRNLSAEEPAELDQDEGSRPEKRLRLDISPSSPKNHGSPTGLPSPALSVDEPLQATQLADSSPPSSLAPVVVSRKRRLSGSESQSVPKRPCHLPVAPRLQTVSDPLPLPNSLLFDEISFDGWFQQIFDRPDVDEISPSGVSVELGDLSDFDCEIPTESRSISSEFSEQTSESPTIKVADITTVSDVPWSEFDFGWADNLSLPSDNLRQSNSLVNFVGQEPLPKPLAQDLANFQVSSQVSRPAIEFENFFNLSNSSIVDPVVIPLNPASNETWDFSESSLNRDDPGIFRKHNAGFESNNALFASFDFSDGADFLPAPDTFFLPTLSQDKSRQEKEKEFREACEKAQRLALELQKDDLLA